MFEQSVRWENDKKTQKQKQFFPHGGIKKRSDLSTLFIFFLDILCYFWRVVCYFCSEHSWRVMPLKSAVGEMKIKKKLCFLFFGWQSMASIGGFNNTIKIPLPDFTRITEVLFYWKEQGILLFRSWTPHDGKMSLELVTLDLYQYIFWAHHAFLGSKASAPPNQKAPLRLCLL